MVTLFSFKTDIIDAIPEEIWVSLVILLIITALCLVIYFKAKKVDPLAPPKGIMLLAEWGVEYVDNFVEKNMGRIFVKKMGPYVGALFIYIFLCFISSLFGVSSPMTYYMVPFFLALGTFILIHYTSMRYSKMKYFKRFIDPFPIFLPVNLISMWAPLISLSFRMFGNACAGWVLMDLVYGVFTMISEAIFGGMQLPIAAAITPALHAYFDVFSGAIQTLIFVSLTTLLVAQEVPETIDVNSFDMDF